MNTQNSQNQNGNRSLTWLIVVVCLIVLALSSLACVFSSTDLFRYREPERERPYEPDHFDPDMGHHEPFDPGMDHHEPFDPDMGHHEPEPFDPGMHEPQPEPWEPDWIPQEPPHLIPVPEPDNGPWFIAPFVPDVQPLPENGQGVEIIPGLLDNLFPKWEGDMVEGGEVIPGMFDNLAPQWEGEMIEGGEIGQGGEVIPGLLENLVPMWEGEMIEGQVMDEGNFFEGVIGGFLQAK